MGGWCALHYLGKMPWKKKFRIKYIFSVDNRRENRYNVHVAASLQAAAIYGGIAQLARAHGSYPWCREFKSPFRYFGKP